MNPLSQDLRERIRDALQAGGASQPEIARRFRVSLSTVERIQRRVRETGSCAALPHGGGPARVLEPYEAWIRAEVKKQPDVTLEELRERLAGAKQVPTSPSMMSRELQLLHLPRKKRLSTTASGKRRR